MLFQFNKKLLFTGITIVFSLAIIIVSCELLLLFFKPQDILYPRLQYNAMYGSVLANDTTMIHEIPGRWKFIYSINSLGYRGPLIPISNKYLRYNIVILGDSYAFGTGVNDGEELSAVMQRTLKDNFDVINLSVGGYGLTQEIRRYYEFGQLYQPEFVILQFCSNDPEDNFINFVTEVKEGRFVFKNTNNSAAWIKIYVSDSIIQKSQLYNFIANLLIRQIRPIILQKSEAGLAVTKPTQDKSTRQTNFYNDLLEAFAKDLSDKKVTLLMISVNKQLNEFPEIKNKVYELDRKGLLKYIEVEPWFYGVTNYGTPEGHTWGKVAHEIIGKHLSQIIMKVAEDHQEYSPKNQ